MPGTANRGGAAGQVQNTTFAAVVASTSAERSGPNAARPAQPQPRQHQRGDDEVRQPVVVPGRLREHRAGRGQVVERRLDVQVQPPLGPPQPGRVRDRGGTAGPDRQPHQGVAAYPAATMATSAAAGSRGQARLTR